MSEVKYRKKYDWEINIEYVTFLDETRRRLSYELFAESIVNAYKNMQKHNKRNKLGLEKEL